MAGKSCMQRKSMQPQPYSFSISRLMHTLDELRAGQLAGTQRLKLACGLQEFPREIFELADTLEILDLSGNQLSSLPDDLPRLHRLRVLFCSDNQFTELPAVLGQFAHLSMIGFKANQIAHVPASALPAALRWLILTDNRMEELPAEIGHCTHLQKLMLAGNRLRTLPPSLAACKRLELLRIAANQLTALPEFLLSLPRLTWLAYAGNPFCASLEAAAVGQVGIPWTELTVQHLLGEGASGMIYQAQWHQDTHVQPVALKLFKGAVTSDGLPHCEMAASLQAGGHACLIPVQGRVAGHPDGAQGLVMGLVEPGFGNLAGPPSLASCTRDVYAAATTFDLPSVIQMALGMASAARHLHEQGLMHGDLYAHNMLHNGKGVVLLGDFGAASFVALQNRPQARSLQRLEVRAFGCLLEELLGHCHQPVEPDPAVAALVALETACLQDDPAARPLFDEIERRLHSLTKTASAGASASLHLIAT